MIADRVLSILHHKEGYDGTKLDLAYITPQLIASAMPTDKFFQSFYRTDARKLVEFLNDRHGGEWHVWNLQEAHELRYDIDNIGNSGSAVTHVPVPDHRPMPLALLVKTAVEIREYVAANPARVALVHCKCGKGRTGSLVTAYLMLFNGMSYQRATSEFTQKRIRRSIVDGITIKSQQRYLRYLEQWIMKGADMSVLAPVAVEIVKVVIRNLQIEQFELELQPLESSSGEVRPSPGDLPSPASVEGSPGTNSPPHMPRLLNKTTHGGHKKFTWDMIILKDRLHVLKPVDPTKVFPADLWFHFRGYEQRAGLRIPTSTASFSVNVLFEPDMLLAATTDLTCLEDTASMVCQLGSEDGVSSFTQHWDDTDGLFGLAFRGIRAFDSIEVFWKRASPSASPVAWSPLSEPAPHSPPSINTVQGRSEEIDQGLK